MKEPLIILCPLRSFSSVVSCMLGEHPEAYGFPELNLFVAETIGSLLEYHRNLDRPRWDGLLRTLAQLHEGLQTEDAIMNARVWLQNRKKWTTKALFDYLLEHVDPKMGVEKSPATVMQVQDLERAYRMYSKAHFLHLTRHPISAGKSIQNQLQIKAQAVKNKIDNLEKSSSENSDEDEPVEAIKRRFKLNVDKLIDPHKIWLTAHQNIVRFTDSLPPGQSMRIKGEDLLSDPDLYLPQISEWLGLSTDLPAIQSMKHPETSCYACFGPVGAKFGNDYKFLEEPKLRVGKVKEPLIKDSKHLTPDQDLFDAVESLANRFGYL